MSASRARAKRRATPRRTERDDDIAAETAMKRLSTLGVALLIVVMTAVGAAPAYGQRPSEFWSPHPSEPWSPRPSEAWTAPNLQTVATETPSFYVADLPNGATTESTGVDAAEESFFAAPPMPPDDGCDYRSGDASIDSVLTPWEGWQVHSSFMPMLGRYGLVAPRTPGVDSVHSPFMGARPGLFNGPLLQGQFAAQPQCAEESVHHSPPLIDPRSEFGLYSSADFSPDPFYDQIPWDGYLEQSVYGAKYLNPVQRPLVEWGMPLYGNGPVPPPSLDFGVTNPSVERFYVYGDYRAAFAYNAQNGSDLGVLAHRLNLELDYWFTATERVHSFLGPLQEGGNFDRIVFDDGDVEYFDVIDFFDENTDTLFFEGDLGAMIGGFSGMYSPFEAPMTVGLIPLLFQNGVWLEDALVGMAMTIPARNSPQLDWSNYDVTFFFGSDLLNTPAFGTNDTSNVYGATTFIEAKGGYLEAGYAFLEDPTAQGRSYNNIGISYTRRYLNLVSNSMRVIFNTGQSGPVSQRTADGVLLLAENSFLTPWPYNVIPYVNAFVGIDRPQSVARAAAAGGVLRNTGILFESDNLTGYPTLDATANNTAGAAIGLDLLAPGFTHQLIVEAAALQAYGNPAFRNAPGDQYGLGLRYQFPISYRYLLRFDVMHGWFENADDVTGARSEFRWKF